MLHCVPDSTVDPIAAIRIFDAEIHLSRIEGMLSAMRFMATSEMIDEDVASPLTAMIQHLEDDCALLRKDLLGKQER